MLNDGLANFVDSGQVIRMTTGGTDAIAIGDLDGDGDSDAYFGNRSFSQNPDEVWLNDGTGLFSNTAQLIGNETSANVLLGDMDSDNDLDVVVASIMNPTKYVSMMVLVTSAVAAIISI